VVGYVTGALGGVALAAGGALALRAYQLNERSLDQCAEDDPNACTTRGKNLRDEATRYGSRGTVAASIGAGLLVGGVVLILTAPDDEDATESGALWLAPHMGGASLGGSW
jgi:hypothetical protein